MIKMNILLTGAFGNVGLSTLKELINRGHDVRIFEIKNSRNKTLAKKFRNKIEIIWGDLRNLEEVEVAIKERDIVIHVAAIIPPLADHKPKFAEAVNVGGTLNIIKAIEKQPQKPRLIFTSSIAIYGDRRKNPLINPSDHPNPNEDDEYAKQKLKCEALIKKSKLDWAIFRLTYIVSPNKLQMDPIMFEMPLETSIEICDTKDVGLALANAVESNEIWGKTLHIAGGEKCRTTYADYLDKMLELFGIGKGALPAEAFNEKEFHCGFMATEKSQELLYYQRHTIDDYYREVKKKVAFMRIFTITFRPIVRKYLLNKSPYYKSYLAKTKIQA